MDVSKNQKAGFFDLMDRIVPLLSSSNERQFLSECVGKVRDGNAMRASLDAVKALETIKAEQPFETADQLAIRQLQTDMKRYSSVNPAAVPAKIGTWDMMDGVREVAKKFLNDEGAKTLHFYEEKLSKAMDELGKEFSFGNEGHDD